MVPSNNPFYAMAQTTYDLRAQELIVGKFLSNMPTRFEAATGDVRLCAIVVDCDERTGRAREITRVMVR
jgi:calcineurin-like phosphoesterase